MIKFKGIYVKEDFQFNCKNLILVKEVLIKIFIYLERNLVRLDKQYMLLIY